jgi:hypothetical protein
MLGNHWRCIDIAIYSIDVLGKFKPVTSAELQIRTFPDAEKKHLQEGHAVYNNTAINVH